MARRKGTQKSKQPDDESHEDSLQGMRVQEHSPCEELYTRLLSSDCRMPVYACMGTPIRPIQASGALENELIGFVIHDFIDSIQDWWRLDKFALLISDVDADIEQIQQYRDIDDMDSYRRELRSFENRPTRGTDDIVRAIERKEIKPRTDAEGKVRVEPIDALAWAARKEKGIAEVLFDKPTFFYDPYGNYECTESFFRWLTSLAPVYPGRVLACFCRMNHVESEEEDKPEYKDHPENLVDKREKVKACQKFAESVGITIPPYTGCVVEERLCLDPALYEMKYLLARLVQWRRQLRGDVLARIRTKQADFDGVLIEEYAAVRGITLPNLESTRTDIADAETFSNAASAVINDGSKTTKTGPGYKGARYGHNKDFSSVTVNSKTQSIPDGLVRAMIAVLWTKYDEGNTSWLSEKSLEDFGNSMGFRGRISDWGGMKDAVDKFRAKYRLPAKWLLEYRNNPIGNIPEWRMKPRRTKRKQT